MPSSSGRRVGRYVFHDRIAAGGMATVHVGRLLGAAGFSRTVAIKRLHDQYALDANFVAMLLDEARLAAQVRSPNVVQTLDVVAEDSDLLVVMEYIEGDSIAHLAKTAGTIPEGIAANVIAQMLRGLHAAHEAHGRDGEPLGIVHRDVSPQNVLVGTDGIARVLDFGIARAASRSTSTDDGIVKGKSAYMAPEQIKRGQIDRRTDIFASGIMLWELLSGKRLFLGETPAETMTRVLTQPIETPPGTPALAAIAMKALSREQAARYATAEEMANAIEEAIPMPRARDVGAFVSTTSAETLAQRAELVAAVERESHQMLAATTDPSLKKAIEIAESRRAVAELATDVGQDSGKAAAAAAASSGTLRMGNAANLNYGASSQPPAPVAEERTDLATVNSTAVTAMKRRGAWPVIVALMVGIAAAIVVVFVVARRGDVKTAAATASATASAIPTAEPIASMSAPTDAGVAIEAKDAGKPIAKPVVGKPIKKPDCRVPFIIDKNGQKHFREECVE